MKIAHMIAAVLAVIAALLVLCLYGLDLGEGSIWNTDDALYGHLVRHMVAEQRWSILAWFDYELGNAYPLGIGYMAAVARLAGTEPFGLRLPALLAAFATLLLLASVRGDRGDRTGGLVAAGLIATQPLFFVLSQRVLHDALLGALCLAALFSYHHARTSERSTFFYLGAGLLCGLASLTKMGAGLLPLAVIALEVLLFDRTRLRRGALWAGALLALGLPVAWFARSGQLGLIAASLAHRFSTDLAGHGAPTAVPEVAGPLGTGTLPTILAQGPPGVVLLALGVAGALLALRRRGPLDRLLLVWSMVTALVLGVMSTYLTHYALQLMLPLSLLGGGAVAAVLRARPLLEPIPAALVIGLLFYPAQQVHFARHADDRVAQLAQRQAQSAPDSLLCTVDLYHAASVFYADRAVAYLTEDEASRRILRRTFGERTVPELAQGELGEKLSAAPAFSCLVTRRRLPTLLTTLRGPYVVIEPEAALLGPEVVLLERTSRP